MSQTWIELFKGIPDGTRTDKLVSLSCVKDTLTKSNLTVERFEKLDPESKSMLFCGALVGVKVDKEKVVLVKLVA
jgi:hypothetical protein